MKTVYKIFAYGSLINQASLKKTVPEARNIIPAKTYGLQRVFNLASNYRFDADCNSPVCVLNIAETDAASALNGTCFEMDEDHWIIFYNGKRDMTSVRLKPITMMMKNRLLMHIISVLISLRPINICLSPVHSNII
jgi:cation transport regulator ChaC